VTSSTSGSAISSVRAYLLKEAFQQLWDYNSPAWAGKFLDEWCRQTMRSRIDPMKKIARSLRQHRELILNLLPGSKADFQRRCRGSEQQGQSHHEKILRLPYLSSPRTCSLSLTWQAARAGINPRFLLTSLFYLMDSGERGEFFSVSSASSLMYKKSGKPSDRPTVNVATTGAHSTGTRRRLPS
jgi:transposase